MRAHSFFPILLQSVQSIQCDYLSWFCVLLVFVLLFPSRRMQISNWVFWMNCVLNERTKLSRHQWSCLVVIQFISALAGYPRNVVFARVSCVNLPNLGSEIQLVCVFGCAGLMSTYHARNEYCLLSDLKKGFKVLTNVIALLEEWVAWHSVAILNRDNRKYKTVAIVSLA